MNGLVIKVIETIIEKDRFIGNLNDLIECRYPSNIRNYYRLNEEPGCMYGSFDCTECWERAAIKFLKSKERVNL